MKSNYENKILEYISEKVRNNKNLHNKQVFVSKKKLNETLYFYRDAGFTDAGIITSKYYKHYIMKRNNEIVMINVFKSEVK